MEAQVSKKGDFILIAVMFATFLGMVITMHHRALCGIFIAAMAVEMPLMFKRLPHDWQDDLAAIRRPDVPVVEFPSKPIVVIHGFVGGNPTKWHFEGAIMDLPPSPGRKATGYANIVWYYGRNAEVAVHKASY